MSKPTPTNVLLAHAFQFVWLSVLASNAIQAVFWERGSATSAPGGIAAGVWVLVLGLVLLLCHAAWRVGVDTDMLSADRSNCEMVARVGTVTGLGVVFGSLVLG